MSFYIENKNVGNKEVSEDWRSMFMCYANLLQLPPPSDFPACKFNLY
jgi:hypothetical protein